MHNEYFILFYVNDKKNTKDNFRIKNPALSQYEQLHKPRFLDNFLLYKMKVKFHNYKKNIFQNLDNFNTWIAQCLYWSHIHIHNII